MLYFEMEDFDNLNNTTVHETNFSRSESVVLYTSGVLFAIILLYILYRVLLIAWEKMLLKIRPQTSESSTDSRQDRRIRELLQRPSLRNLLASRAEFVQERQRRLNANETRRMAATDIVSQKPDGGWAEGVPNTNTNGDPSSMSSENTIHTNEVGEVVAAAKNTLPPPYDSLSMYSGPPPSYHSDDNT